MTRNPIGQAIKNAEIAVDRLENLKSLNIERWLLINHRFFFCRFLESKIDLVGVLLRENVPERFNFFLARNTAPVIMHKRYCRFYAQCTRLAYCHPHRTHCTKYTIHGGSNCAKSRTLTKSQKKRKKGLQSEKYLL